MISPFLKTGHRTDTRHDSGISSCSQIMFINLWCWFSKHGPPFFNYSDAISSSPGVLSFLSIFNSVSTSLIDGFSSSYSTVVSSFIVILVIGWFKSFVNISLNSHAISLLPVRSVPFLFLITVGLNFYPCLTSFVFPKNIFEWLFLLFSIVSMRSFSYSLLFTLITFFTYLCLSANNLLFSSLGSCSTFMQALSFSCSSLSHSSLNHIFLVFLGMYPSTSSNMVLTVCSTSFYTSLMWAI